MGKSETENTDYVLDSLDLSRAPRGELAAAALVEALARGDDRQERHFLELKSALDLSSKSDKAKILKFILGAANRSPELAANAFEGYGVMVIGVSQGEVRGVEPIEMLQIAQVVEPSLGASGPRWDIVRVPVKDSPNEVLVVLVEPPLPGQGPFICRAHGESLVNGRVYIRADGETREAKADELDQLIARGKQAVAAVAFQVKIAGWAFPVAIDETITLELHVSEVRSSLLNSLQATRAIENDPAAAAMLRQISYVESLSPLYKTVNETRTESDFLSEIDDWEDEYRKAWIRVTNLLVASCRASR